MLKLCSFSGKFVDEWHRSGKDGSRDDAPERQRLGPATRRRPPHLRAHSRTVAPRPRRGPPVGSGESGLSSRPGSPVSPGCSSRWTEDPSVSLVAGPPAGLQWRGVAAMEPRVSRTAAGSAGGHGREPECRGRSRTDTKSRMVEEPKGNLTSGRRPWPILHAWPNRRCSPSSR